MLNIDKISNIHANQPSTEYATIQFCRQNQISTPHLLHMVEKLKSYHKIDFGYKVCNAHHERTWSKKMVCCTHLTVYSNF